MTSTTFTDVEEKAVNELKKSLKELLGNRLISLTLFGSRARGDFDVNSDIDIAVIVRGLTRDLKNQVLDRVAKIEFDFVTPLSVLVLSEDDFNFLKKRERRIALDIVEQGVTL